MATVIIPTKRGNQYFLPGEVPDGQEEQPIPVDARNKNPAVTSCCNKVYSKADLRQKLIDGQNPDFTCPNSKCKKPISATSLGICPKKSSEFPKEYKIVTKEAGKPHPFTGKIDGFAGCVASCCDKEISRGRLDYHLSNRSVSDLGSCPNCKTALDLEDVRPGYSVKRTLITIFEYTARIATVVALAALCLSSPTFMYVSAGIAITAIALGIITTSNLTNTEFSWSTFHFTFSACLLCTGSALIFLPFFPNYAVVAGISLGLILSLGMEFLLSSEEE